MHLRPYIFSNKNINHTNIDDIKLKVVNTLKFEQLYMIDIQSQLKFLLRDETVQYIKEESKRGIGNHSINVKDEYIVGLLKHEINSYRNRYNKNHDNKVTNKEIGKIYYHGMSRFKTKDIFTIIRDTISKIISTINIEQNMINTNKKLDKWNTVLGNHNDHGIRQYTSIKLNIQLNIDSSNIFLSEKIEKILSEIDLVEEYQINQFDNEIINFEVLSNSTPDKLINELEKYNINISTENNIWTLSE